MVKKMPTGLFRGISLKAELINEVEALIEKLTTYRSVAEFVSEATRLRLEQLKKVNDSKGASP